MSSVCTTTAAEMAGIRMIPRNATAGQKHTTMAASCSGAGRECCNTIFELKTFESRPPCVWLAADAGAAQADTASNSSSLGGVRLRKLLSMLPVAVDQACRRVRMREFAAESTRVLASTMVLELLSPLNSGVLEYFGVHHTIET